ncbi:hypothetical protein AGOR_G00082620 [Albula goreensis]|uniref:Uncharacterized protein n=1 Tax=Albula goreensis TaxID=1534307 RepID=A0A8T3DK80_9TELE|nr:hypothetical protein AGOR_G00082620 [Albula goreensis]
MLASALKMPNSSLLTLLPGTQRAGEIHPIFLTHQLIAYKKKISLSRAAAKTNQASRLESQERAKNRLAQCLSYSITHQRRT